MQIAKTMFNLKAGKATQRSGQPEPNLDLPSDAPKPKSPQWSLTAVAQWSLSVSPPPAQGALGHFRAFCVP